MEIQIDNETRIADFQNRFNEVYTYLKVDFFRKQHAEQELSAISDIIPPDELFSSINTFLEPGNIDISPQRTVAQVETEVFDKLGVAMQVSRKSDNVWIQTSRTDNRTLEKQNETGKVMSERG